MTPFEKSGKFMYRNARPVDLARWQYHFRNGSKENVIKILAEYQNEDGGFGHGLEEDCLNPNSAPIQTWTATEILREIEFTDRNHPMIQGILKYLSSGLGFDEEHRQWLNTVPSNNDYPHAIWWTYHAEEVQDSYNPTACLVGFFLKCADRDHAFYDTAVQIAKEAYQSWLLRMPYADQHITACYIRLYEYCQEAGLEIMDMEEFRQKLIAQVKIELDGCADKWETDYVCMPSNFIKSKDSIFCKDNAELIVKECEYIKRRQLPDGSFDIPWQWWTEYKEFELVKNWWKAEFCIRNMKFLQEFDRDME